MTEVQHESKQLGGRHLAIMENTPEMLAEHFKITGGKTRTRFPPEPNGYLHIGHAKSCNMNFEMAFDKLEVPKDKRYVFFRYDDTNPEKESQEYIDAIAESVAWLGWKPDITTFSSDYFQELYDLAIKLIKKGLAYVCHQTKDEIEVCRQIIKRKLKAKEEGATEEVEGDQCSPWRNRSVEENLELFEKMRVGRFAEGEATLRMKMDMNSPNPNMWDSIAYRLKYTPHPHAGRGWCIYPSYDYTHCIVDALEHIDYSICTLEFETRRESYYWLLDALDLFKPQVYEFARLNLEFTFMSKRKILQLVEMGQVRGWSDPRLSTLYGLRRRGYDAEIINQFCTEIGVSRSNSLIRLAKFESVARKILDKKSVRAMAVLDPIKVIITNLEEPVEKDVPDLPFGDSKMHKVTITKEIYIDRRDFKLKDEADFRGLAPGKEVLLKYFCNFKCTDVKQDDGKVVELRGEADFEMKNKCPGTLTWVSSQALRVEVREYGTLFTVPDLADKEHKDTPWQSLLNPNSEIIHANAMVDPSVAGLAPDTQLQFERLGYYVVDPDSTSKRMVFNSIVSLREKKAAKAPRAKAANDARKEKQADALAAKEAAKNINPTDMFKGQTDDYSKFDDKGIPTHDAAGTPLSKNASKKLAKLWAKQKKLFERNQE